MFKRRISDKKLNVQTSEMVSGITERKKSAGSSGSPEKSIEVESSLEDSLMN
jgi:hypothetical protein